MRCVSWNLPAFQSVIIPVLVAPRMRCVSWNYRRINKIVHCVSCTSYEVCELKCIYDSKGDVLVELHLVWGVWVEIINFRWIPWTISRCTSYEVCELKFLHSTFGGLICKLHLVWGVWVEICIFGWWEDDRKVAPRMRCVSWNVQAVLVMIMFIVAPRMRCVSWNCCFYYLLNYCFCCTSYEVCELKFICLLLLTLLFLLHLVWGVWVEIMIDKQHNYAYELHLVWGVWVEIQRNGNIMTGQSGCTSYEVCELKFLLHPKKDDILALHLVWGVWVEIG